MGILEAVMLALASVPHLVKGYETLFSGKKKSGRRKKKLLMETSKIGLSIAKVPKDQQAVILNAVSSITDTTVREMNAARPQTR